MKILQLTNKVPYPPKDGGSIAALNMTKGFAALGHQVTLLTMNTAKHYYEISKIPEDIRNLAIIRSVDVEARVTIRGAVSNLLFSRRPYNAQRFLSKNYTEELEILLQREQFDIIQLEGLYLGMYIPVIRKYSDGLIALRAHNIEYEIWQRIAANEHIFWRKKYMGILARRIKRMEIQLLNSYDVLIPITKRDNHILNVLGNTRPSLTSPTGIDSSCFIPERGAIDFPSLFHVGALDWAPNQEGILWFLENVWSAISEKYPDLNFYLAGRNAPAWFIKKIEEYRVVFLGEIDDAYSLMNSKALMVVPLFSGSGMRIKIIEGMALGKTILTTSIGTEGIETTHNKNILIADTRQGFIDEIERVIKDRKFFNALGTNANKFVNEFYDNKSIIKSLLEFYESQIKSRRE